MIDITEHKGLLLRILDRYDRRTLSLPDMIQAGYIGLTKAVKRYDPERAQWSTYAKYWVRREVGRALIKENKHSVCDSENTEIPGTEDLTIADKLSSSNNVEQEISTRERANFALASLTPIEREVVLRRICGEEILREVGDSLGLSYERVRQIQVAAIEKMRSCLK